MSENDAVDDDGRQDEQDCLRMREASGNVADDRRLVSFLYLLVRDHVPMGVIEAVIDDVMEVSDADGSTVFTNGWLARWAQDASNRLE